MTRVDVLVVEDDPHLLGAMTEVLREEGFSVRAFASSTSALAAILALPPRLVITDEEMPGLPGHELMRRARERLADRAPRFVLVTSANVPAAHLRGFDGIVYKPFRLDDLLAHTRRLRPHRTISGVRAKAGGENEAGGKNEAGGASS
jgi:DNA-binding response OmpR family regulator